MSLDKEFMKWVTEISAWLMSAQAIVLTIIQVFNVAFPWRHIVIVSLILGIFGSTLTITGAVNYVARGSNQWKRLTQWMSNITVWSFLVGLMVLGISVIFDA